MSCACATEHPATPKRRSAREEISEQYYRNVFPTGKLYRKGVGGGIQVEDARNRLVPLNSVQQGRRVIGEHKSTGVVYFLDVLILATLSLRAVSWLSSRLSCVFQRGEQGTRPVTHEHSTFSGFGAYS